MTRPTLNAILQLHCTGRACAVDTTEDLSVRFDAVADDTGVAVGANGRKRVNCALEALEGSMLNVQRKVELRSRLDQAYNTLASVEIFWS